MASIFWSVGLVNARQDPLIHKVSIDLPRWPQNERAIRILLMSDIHFGSAAMDFARLERIVGIANNQHPDIVLLAGDFVDGRSKLKARQSMPKLSTALKRLYAPLGVVAVLGNHDHDTDPAFIARALGQIGITVLSNRAIRRGPLAIGGLDDPSTGQDQVETTLKSLDALPGARIILAHTPKPIWRLPKDGMLLLAGHTHCGQIRISPIWAAMAKQPDFRCGIVRDRRRTTIVTGGLGTSFLPLRFAAPPDVWLIRVGPA